MRSTAIFRKSIQITPSSMTLSTPVLPSWHHVPEHSVRVIWVCDGRLTVCIGSRKETLSGSRMLLLQDDTRYQAASEGALCTFGEMDISFRYCETALGIAEKLPSTVRGFHEFWTGNAQWLAFIDSEGIVQMCLYLLRESLTEEKRRLTDAGVELLLGILVTAACQSAEASPAGGNKCSDYVKTVLAYIHSHYTEKLDMETLAEVVYLHPNYLHRIFRAQMHCTVGDYLLHYRMEQALKLMVNSDLSAAAAGRACGIADQQQFSKQFRKVYGAPPHTYRRQLNMTCNYLSMRNKFGVINYAIPENSRPITAGVHSLSDRLYQREAFIPVVTGYFHYADLMAVDDVTDHAHPQLEIMYVQEGEITVVAAGSESTIHQGEYIWVDAGVRHQLTLCHDHQGSMITIEIALVPAGSSPVPSLMQLYAVDSAFAALADSHAQWRVFNDSHNMMGQLLNHMVIIASRNTEYNATLNSLLAMQCLNVMGMHYCNGQYHAQEQRQGPSELYAVVNQLEQLYASHLRNEELAAACQMSPAALQRLVRRYSGMTVNEYIRRFRIEKSIPLLQAHLSVQEVAQRVGYQSEKYFSRQFYEVTGMKPAQFTSVPD